MEVVEEEREVKERESYRQDAGIPFFDTISQESSLS